MSDEKELKDKFPIDLPSVMERIGGDESFLLVLLDIYVEDFLEKYAQLKKAVEGCDFVAIKEIGHSLRGSSGNLSLTKLYRISEKIEQSGIEKNIGKAKLLFIQLDKEFERLKNCLPNEIQPSADPKQKGVPCSDNFSWGLAEKGKKTGIRILAADDSIPNQVLMKFYANQAGFQIDMAENGREAVDLFRKNSYSIVLLDIHMPELDGFEALNLMRQFEIENVLPETPIIALTGSTFEEKGTTCIEAGFDDFMEKSDIHELLDAIIQKHVKDTTAQDGKIRLDKTILPLVPEYLENRKADLQRIRLALDNRNFSEIEDLGHKMKGSGKCYGFEMISTLGHKIEFSAKEHNASEIEESVIRMKAYLSNLRYK